MKNLKTKDIAIVAVMIAIGIICAMPFPNGLTFYAMGNSMKFSPLFLIIALVARKYNAIVCCVVACAVDMLQPLLSGMTINPLISLSAALTGVIFSLFMKGKISFVKIFAAVMLSQAICSIGITTFAIWIYYQTPLEVLLPLRLLQSAIYICIELVVLPLLFIKFDIAKRIKFV